MPKVAPAVAGQAADAANAKQQPTESAPLPVRIIESASDAEHTKDRESKSDKHDAEDLDAQIRAANAVEKQVVPTWASAVLTFAGTVLLVWNLTEARRANRIARKGVRVAQDVARRELRPYITVDRWEVPWRGTQAAPNVLNSWEWTIIWKNSGQTPAHNVHARLSAQFFPTGATPEQIGFPDIGVYPTPAGICGPTQELRSRIQLSVADLTHSWNGNGSVYVWGWIEYDSFDGIQRHRSEVCREVLVGYDPTQIVAQAYFSDLIIGPFNAMDERCVHKPKT